MNSESNPDINVSRRSLLKKSAYVAPAIVSLSVLPTTAAVGSTVSGTDPNSYLDTLTDDQKKSLLQALLDYFGGSI